MKTVQLLLTVIVVFLLFSSYAFAADPSTTSPFMTVFDDVVQVIATSLGVLVLGLLTLAANKIRQKWHLDVPVTWLNKVHAFIDQGIAYAEEQAHKAVDGSTITSNSKLNTALNFVLQFIGNDKELVALGEEKLKQLIEARLNQTRLNPGILMSATSTDVGDAKAAIAAVAVSGEVSP